MSALLLAPGLAALLGGGAPFDIPRRGPVDPPSTSGAGAWAHVTPSSPKPHHHHLPPSSAAGAGGPALGGAGHGAGGTAAAEGEDDYEGLGFSQVQTD